MGQPVGEQVRELDQRIHAILFSLPNIPRLDDLWLIPTAEVPITNLQRDEILPPYSLPIYYVAQTPCFRREKTTTGRDTWSLSGCTSSTGELDKQLADAEEVCQRLGWLTGWCSFVPEICLFIPSSPLILLHQLSGSPDRIRCRPAPGTR